MKTTPASTTRDRRGVAYERISTATQQTDMQRTANIAYAAANAIPINSIKRDTASGSTPWAKRAIAEALTDAPPYTDLIVYELSRIGRDLADTLAFLRDAAANNLTVHISRTGMKIGDDINGKILATVLGLVAEIERDFLITRTTDALAERKQMIKLHGGFTSAAGVWRSTLGRPKGTTAPSKLAPHADKIAVLAAAKVPDAAIARLLQCSRGTVTRFRQSLTKKE